MKVNIRYIKKNKMKFIAFAIVLFLLSVLVVVIPALKRRTSYKTSAQSYPVNLSFSSTLTDIPYNGTTTVRVLMDPNGQEIVALRVIFSFDKTKLALNSEIIPSSAFADVLSVTSMAVANSTGWIEIDLLVPPGPNGPSVFTELAQLSMKNISSAGGSTNLIFIPSGMRFVDVMENSLTVSTQDYVLNLVTQLSPTPTSSPLTPTPVVTSTPTPTKTPTPSPTKTPTPSPTKTPAPTNIPIPTGIGCPSGQTNPYYIWDDRGMRCNPVYSCGYSDSECLGI